MRQEIAQSIARLVLRRSHFSVQALEGGDEKPGGPTAIIPRRFRPFVGAVMFPRRVTFLCLLIASALDAAPLAAHPARALQIEPQALTIVVVEGLEREATLTVSSDAGTVPISIETSVPWLTASGPATVSSDAPGTITVRASAAGMVGVYDPWWATRPQELYPGTVSILSAEGEVVVPVEMVVIRPAVLTASRSSPVMAGTPVTWATYPVSGRGGTLYQYWRFSESSGWVMVRDYSQDSSFTWTPGRDDIGRHEIQVWVRRPESPAAYDTFDSMELVVTAPTLTSFTHAAPSPLVPGLPVQLAASFGAGDAPAEYSFWLWQEGGGWTALRGYSTDGTFVWVPSQAGRYVVQVWARTVGSTAAVEDARNTPLLEVSAAAPVTVQIARIQQSAVSVFEPVDFLAVARGGTPPYQYQFWKRGPTGAWAMVRDYSSDQSYSFTPDLSAIGAHMVQVWVRDAVGAAVDAWANTTVFEVTATPDEVVLTEDVQFPVPHGTPIDWTVKAQGGVPPLEFAFWVWSSQTGWALGQGYSTSTSFRWTPTADGEYAVQVWVRNAGSAAAYDAFRTSPIFTIGPSAPSRIVSISHGAPTPGAPPVFLARGSGGGAGPLLYQFWVFSEGTQAWTLVQDWSPENTWTWSLAETGVFEMQVWVKSSGAPALENWGWYRFAVSERY